MQNPKDVYISVLFYHTAVEWNVTLVYFTQVLCQMVS